MQAIDLELRPYRDEDEARVLDVLNASLGAGPAGERSPEFFHWKHLTNPFGRSYMLLAEVDGRIAGLRAFMRWRFRAGDRFLSAVRAVDTATHPDFQGLGVFSRLTKAALESLRAEGVDLVFNTPNSASLPGYLKMGWRVVGDLPIWIRVRRPVRFVRRMRATSGDPGPAPAVDAPSAPEALAGSSVDELLAAADAGDHRIHTVRDRSYLTWRYAEAPLLDYRAVTESSRGRIDGIAIFRVRPRDALWEATVSELIVRPGDTAVARGLLRRVRTAARVDHLACHFADGTTARRALRGAAFIRAPRGMKLTTNPLRDGIEPTPTDPASWAVSVGDLEVF